MMRLYKYDVNFEYVPGSKLVIADTLSRAYLQQPKSEENIMKIGISDMKDEIPDARLEEIREATKTDDDLQMLLKIIREGWPNEKSELPEEIRPYFDIKETLSFDTGIIMKGEQVLVPKSL